MMNAVKFPASVLQPSVADRLEQRGLAARSADVMHGALVFSGTRVLVDSLFEYLREGASLEQFLDDFPSVSRIAAVGVLEQVRANLAA